MTLFRRLLVLLLASTAADAEESRPDQLLRQYPHTSWTERDGLPSPPIYAIGQDREGYLWIGSTSGLARFDGVHFVSWESISGLPLPQTTIRCLCFTRDNSLWLGFHNCSQEEFLEMVDGYAAHYKLPVKTAELHAGAIEWSVTRGSRSGRVAWQYIQDVAGRTGTRLSAK